ncbi:MAG: penicillin acylase family protein [Saprospiraceae bacterium]|nr:penicillin acylase family protein [Saprospiraceae bacterium]
MYSKTIPILLGWLIGSTFLYGQKEMISVQGLTKPVEILVDRWGVPHIYAQSEHDLFFAQGYYAARDRLFQFEVWRRQATGTCAEWLGVREINRDIGTRLFKFRGDLEQELNHYHPHGAAIVGAYVEGVNAYIDLVRKDTSLLPVEFKILNTLPQRWTPEVVISRHQGLLGNIDLELEVSRMVARLGADKVRDLYVFEPHEPDLTLDPAIDTAVLFSDVLGLYHAYRRPLQFFPDNDMGYAPYQPEDAALRRSASIGSNNWIVNGHWSSSGYPMLANDPHRAQSIPSLRYMAHLVAPGWDVIGGGEPEIPGISIGHNAYGAWGLTVFATDAEDLYMYHTNPVNPDQYWFQGAWETFRKINDTIVVKGSDPVYVTHRYSRHGPVLYADTSRQVACAMRCGWLEPGGSPYLASLRMDQATNFEEFQEACTFSNIPGENMIWADRNGHIGWQAVGIAPIRRHFSGLVVLPGDGRYEWDGYLPIQAKPHLLDPDQGYWVTANNQVTPRDYAFPEALGYTWSAPYRSDRITEFLRQGRALTLQDFATLQTDYTSLPARELIPMLTTINWKDALAKQAVNWLTNWDKQLNPESREAAIYVTWQQLLSRQLEERAIPDRAKNIYGYLDMRLVIKWLHVPPPFFGKNPIESRDQFIENTFQQALANLKERLGKDPEKWQYGDPRFKHIFLEHALAPLASGALAEKLNAGPLPRGGDSYTVNNSGSRDNQTSGPSFKILVDTRDWEQCLAMNNPGQSGNPDSPFYRNLFELWQQNQYFPLYFQRKKVEENSQVSLILKPQ